MSNFPTKKPKAGARVVRVIFTVLGLLLLVFGGLVTVASYDFVDNSAVTTGRVVSVAVDYTGDSVSYKPTIRFLDQYGRKHRSETLMSSSNYNFSRNQSVEVRYDLRDPSSLRMNTWFAIWGIGFIILGAGAVLLFISRFIGRKVRQTRKIIVEEGSAAEIEVTFAEHLFDEAQKPSGAVLWKRRHHDKEPGYQPTVRKRRR